MLNTESRLAKALIWLVVLYIGFELACAIFKPPSLAALLQALRDSALADIASRNQTLVGAVVGFGGLALALVLNGWRDRAERRHAIERRERRLAQVLAREAQALAEICDVRGRQLATRAAGDIGSALEELVQATDEQNSVLLDCPPADLAGLGAGAAAATGTLRSKARHLAGMLQAAGEDGSKAKDIGLRALRVAHAARDAAHLLATVAEKGPAVADKMRLVAAPEPDMTGDTQNSPRLVSSA